jgi:hypothetical protein
MNLRAKIIIKDFLLVWVVLLGLASLSIVGSTSFVSLKNFFMTVGVILLAALGMLTGPVSVAVVAPGALIEAVPLSLLALAFVFSYYRYQSRLTRTLSIIGCFIWTMNFFLTQL